MKNNTVIFYIFTLLFAALAPLAGAQEGAETGEEAPEYPLEPPEGIEAPEHVLDLELGALGADVYWEGYWRYRLTWGTGWEKGPDGLVFPAPYPGLQQGLQFSQEPDFFLSVFLMDHYFIETSFTEGFDQNTYVMGYAGDEDSVVREVRIGNAGIGIGEYEGIDVSSPKYNTPGVSAAFQTQKSEHEFMIRYDPTEEQTKTFLGEWEVTEEDVLLPDYRTGQYFILPNGNVSGVKLYAEDSSGELTGSDGRRYTARNLEYTLDSASGLITLSQPAEGRIAVWYTASGGDVGDPGAAENFIMDTDSRDRPDPTLPLLPFSREETDPYDPLGRKFEETAFFTLDNRQVLLIHSPGEYSSFQKYNRYEFHTNIPDEAWRTAVSLTDKGAPVQDGPDYNYLTDRDSRILTVLVKETDERSPWNRVPFAPANPEIYGPGRETDGQALSRELHLAVKEDSENFFLGTGLIDGSVTVRVNGVEDQSVFVNYDTGELFFSRYIFPEDRIEVTYRTESAGLTGGDLFMAQGNRLFLSDAMTLELAESLRWTIPDRQMTEEPGESPGKIDLAGTWFYDRDNLQMKVSTGLNFTTADTAGNLRILGMEKGGFTFSMTHDQAVPSETALTPNPESLAPENREELTYRNFESVNNTGQTYLNDYTWSAPADSAKEGPSVAASLTDDPFSSRVMVMTYDLTAGEWSAGDYLPVEKELIDLSGYSELSFYLRRQNLSGDNLDVTLLLGENGESEDRDENGTADRGDIRYVLTVPDIPLPSQENRWEKVTLRLTEKERQRLSRVRSFRFLLTSDSGGSAGELLAAGFRGEGSALAMDVQNAAGNSLDAENINAREVEDATLSRDFPEVSSIFHPDGEDQKVLEVTWGADSPGGTPLAADDTWTGTAWLSSLPPGDYGALSLYLRHEQTGGEGTLSLTDPAGRGITVNYTAGGTSWEKLTVDLREGTASFSGSSAVKSLTLDKDASDFTRFRISRTGLASGTLYLDEVHLAEPTFTTGALVETTLDYVRPGEIVTTAGGFPVLRDWNVNTRLNYYAEQNDSVFSRNLHQLESQLSSGVDLMNVRLEGDLQLKWSGEEPSYTGGHLIRIPAQSSFGWVSDYYTRSFHPGKDFMSRGNVLHLTPHQTLTLEVLSKSNGSSGEITQQWGGWLNWSPGQVTTFRIQTDFYQTSEWLSDSDNYFGDWARDYRYLTPADGETIRREGFNSLSLKRTFGPLGVEWKPSLEYKAENELVWTQENRWESVLSFPLEIPTASASWTLTPGYGRELKQKIRPDSYRGFPDDMNTLFSGVGSQFPLVNFIPFYEIFGHGNLEDFEKTLTLTDDSEYTPELFFRMNRSPGSRLTDLFLPSGLDLSTSREYYKKQDSLYWEHDWNFQILQSAINLFGDWGRYPLFGFYKTDEWTSSFQYTLSGREVWTPEPEEIIYQNYVSLAGESTWEFVLDNRFSYRFEEEELQNDFQMILRWREPEKPWLKIPFFERVILKPSRMEHEEKLIFTGFFDQDEWDKTSYDTILRHESKLMVTGLGSLKGWMALGLGGKADLFRNGYELGVELEMNF